MILRLERLVVVPVAIVVLLVAAVAGAVSNEPYIRVKCCFGTPP